MRIFWISPFPSFSYLNVFQFCISRMSVSVCFSGHQRIATYLVIDSLTTNHKNAIIQLFEQKFFPVLTINSIKALLQLFASVHSELIASPAENTTIKVDLPVDVAGLIESMPAFYMFFDSLLLTLPEEDIDATATASDPADTTSAASADVHADPSAAVTIDASAILSSTPLITDVQKPYVIQQMREAILQTGSIDSIKFWLHALLQTFDQIQNRSMLQPYHILAANSNSFVAPSTLFAPFTAKQFKIPPAAVPRLLFTLKQLFMGLSNLTSNSSASLRLSASSVCINRQAASTVIATAAAP